jgi:hypothetical protein
MLKIVVNHNKQDVIYSFTVGQTFPDVKGKLISVEVSGKELVKLMEKKEIPLCSSTNSFLIWHGRRAGTILQTLREIFLNQTEN